VTHFASPGVPLDATAKKRKTSHQNVIAVYTGWRRHGTFLYALCLRQILTNFHFLFSIVAVRRCHITR